MRRFMNATTKKGGGMMKAGQMDRARSPVLRYDGRVRGQKKGC